MLSDSKATSYYKSIPAASYNEGDNIYISVSAAGGGLLYRWYKGTTLLTSPNGSNATSYSVQNIKLADAGLYKVEVFNSKGTASATFDIKVVAQVIPTFSQQLVDQEAYLNDYVQFSITTSGGGMKYRWFKDDVLLANVTYSNYSRRLTGPSDEGVYKVEASNTMGTIVSSARAKIKTNLQPTLTLSYGSGSVWESENLSINTVTTGGNLTYEWFKDGVKLPNTENHFQPKSDFNQTRPAQVNDAGVYKVIAKNSVGSVSAEVTITIKPLVIPRIIYPPRDAALAVGDYFTLSVSAEGGGLKYKWYKDGLLIQNATRDYISGSNDPDLTSIYFTAAAAGTYRVEVSNSVGTVSASATLTVRP